MKDMRLLAKMDWTFWTAIPALAILPFVCPYAALATNILVYAIFALGYNLLLGYTGWLSFGHAAFFGLGAYATGLLLVKAHASVWLAIVAGIVP